MIKTIIFDNHGVITSSTAEGADKKFADFLGVDLDRFNKIWGSLEGIVDEGKMTSDDFLKNLLHRTNCHKDLSDFKKIYFGSYPPKLDVQGFAKKLGKSFEIVLLTNYGSSFRYVNDRSWHLGKIFGDKIFVSAELKMRKPHKDIYLYVLDKIGKKPEETVFIDDNPEFIKTAQELGMHTILFKSLDQVKKNLEEILALQGQSLQIQGLSL